MRRLLLAIAAAGCIAFMAAPARADDWSVGVRVGGYYDDGYYHRYGHYGHDGTWYRASPNVTYYGPYSGAYCCNNGFTIRYGTPVYHTTPYYRTYDSYERSHRHYRHR